MNEFKITLWEGGLVVYEELSTPAVVVDLDVVENNIQTMADRMAGQQIQHRPHIKTHKSIQLARKQLDAGAVGITVAKLSEAEVFAAAGFDDILIAYSLVGHEKLQRFAALHSEIALMTTVDSLVVAEGLSRIGQTSSKPVRVLIEVDGGAHRGGRQPGVDTVHFAQSIRHLPGLDIIGIMGYFGQIYREEDEQGLVRAAQHESQLLRTTAEALKDIGVDVRVVSAGSTPACSLGGHLHGITEARAGNYVFYDVSAVDLGIACESDCALRVVATIISTPFPGHATVDAGTKTLTSDKAHHRDGYGIVVGHPTVQIVGLNEEHGMLKYDAKVARFSVGDRIEIIPNHACVIPNLNNVLNGVRQGQVVEQITVDARGCNA